MDASENRALDRDKTRVGSALASGQERAKAPWVVAGAVVLSLLLVLVLSGRRHGTTRPNQILSQDPYARDLQVSDVAMSESTSLSGGKSTFLDGRIQNVGSKTVSGIMVQVLFANDEAMPPQVETVPLMLIRTREPYVDTQPVSAAPLKPGENREFRLIFESLPQNWNMQVPEMRAVRVSTR